MPLVDDTLKRFLAYAKPYRAWIGAATVCGLLKFNLPLLFPLALKIVVDHLTGAAPMAPGDLHLLMLGLIAVYAVWAIAAYYRSQLADTASKRMVFDLRHDFFLHLQHLSLGFYEKRQAGAIGSRLMSDIATAQNFVGAAFINTAMDLSTLALILVILFSQNWNLALIAVVVLPLYAVLNGRFQGRIKATSKRAQEKMEEISGQVHEQLGAVPIIQAYTQEKTEERRFFAENRTHLDYLLENVHTNALAITSVGFLTHVAPVLVIWFGAMQVLNGNLTTGALVAFYAYLGMLYTPLTRLTELNILLANSRSAMERIFEIFDIAPEVVERPNAEEIERAKGDIQFENVQFSYEGQRPVLQNVSLHIPAGSTVALVGRSGAGKTTFVKLLPRFYDVTQGTVRLDGVDVRNLKIRSLRSQIALVTQEPLLFSGTVRDNLRFGRRTATQAELIAAAEAADAHNFICALPQGYDTVIGERGLTLSGGQKQRLTLARAFLKDAPVLILDEATSALDSESENAIRRALQRLMAGRTTLVIAHRLSTIQAADMIVVFEQGRVVEVGTHGALLGQSEGVYRRLHQEQYGTHWNASGAGVAVSVPPAELQ